MLPGQEAGHPWHHDTAAARLYTLLYMWKFRAFQMPGIRGRLFCSFCFVFYPCFVLSFYYLQNFRYFLENFPQNICKCILFAIPLHQKQETNRAGRFPKNKYFKL